MRATEVRGLTLQELRDMDWSVQQVPRTHTILFETDDAIGIIERARAAGYSVIDPKSGEIAATSGVPALRFVEGGAVDPDGHVVSFFQYFGDDDARRAARARYPSARQ